MFCNNSQLGWIKEFNQQYNAYYYVDTNAKPPRSIWTNPNDEPHFAPPGIFDPKRE